MIAKVDSAGKRNMKKCVSIILALQVLGGSKGIRLNFSCGGSEGALAQWLLHIWLGLVCHFQQ